MNTLRLLLLCLISGMLLTACNGKDQQASLFNGEEKQEKGFFEDLLKDKEEAPQDKIAPQDQDASEIVSDSGVALQVKSPKAGDRIETSNTWVMIVGDIANAKDVVKIQVNDYVLHKYRAGQKQFSYIASESMKTLKRGENTYVIKALDKDGKLLSQTTYTIDSDVKYAALSNTGFESWILALIVSVLASGFVMQRKINF